MRFHHPEPSAAQTGIYPVFIPFAGCATRCVFCSQEAQTGLRELPATELENKVIADIESVNAGNPVELAFYGGTFTALSMEVQEKWLRLAMQLKQQGKVTSIRCSTRPDAFTPAHLQRLKELGLDTVELGVQSFSDSALIASRRGYAGKTAENACETVQKAGLRLGIQLMPGMPGQTEADFKHDIGKVLGIAPSMARLYPCLVLRGTALAEIWQNGGFSPWSLEQVFRLLPEALLALWQREIRVIRLGLAPQAGLETEILAGPAHPALGQCLRSLALFRFISGKVALCRGSRFTLLAPRRFQGEFFGHRGDQKEAYKKIGLWPENVGWHDEELFTLESC